VDPAHSAHMFAATDGGLFVTTNGGSSWAKPTSPSYASVDGNINTVVTNPSTPVTAPRIASHQNRGRKFAPIVVLLRTSRRRTEPGTTCVIIAQLRHHVEITASRRRTFVA
jgi:hypothetical protein